MKEHLEESTSKYENPNTYEAFTDINIFFPISDILVTPLRELGLTPNGVTLLSAVFRLFSIFLLSVNQVEYACLLLIIGYLFDCIDGNMARKYNMGSKYGMALDLVSDVLILGALGLYILYDKGFNWQFIVYGIISYMSTLWSGMNDAITYYKLTKSDNFYARKQEEFKNESYLLADIYLLFIKGQYNSYKSLFPSYDNTKIHNWIYTIKEIGGPGNMMFIIVYLIYSLYREVPKLSTPFRGGT